jgi:hypothetical protein
MHHDVYFSTHDISPNGFTDAMSYACEDGSVINCNVSKLKTDDKSYATKPNWSKFVADLSNGENLEINLKMSADSIKGKIDYSAHILTYLAYRS